MLLFEFFFLISVLGMKWLPYLVTLDLFGNEFKVSIPIQIENCKLLNSSSLSENYYLVPFWGIIHVGFVKVRFMEDLHVNLSLLP